MCLNYKESLRYRYIKAVRSHENNTSYRETVKKNA